VSLAQFHCIGRGHQARFSENFDQTLSNAIHATPNPSQATAELDDVALLTVLANFAGAGPYEPSERRRNGPFPVLEIDEAQPALRVFRWHWWWAGAPIGRFAFAGRTLVPSQTVVFGARFEPARAGGVSR
jgi:hypothetical protein